MYKVFLDGIAIYDPMIGIALTDPTVELAEGKSGSFTCGIPPGNPGYGKIKKLVSVIEVLQDHDSLFVGRVLSAEKDFYGVETITCEGELAYLLDSIQRPAEYHDITVRGFLQTLIDNHNAQVEEAKQFEVGEVTVTDSNDNLYRYTNWETTLDDINDKLVSRLGGHIRIRHADGHRYIDYLADFDNTNTQTIAFGENLLDYTENTTADDLATCIIPLGAAIENQTDDPQALQKYTTCAGANSGSDYVCDSDAIANYGRVFKVVHFDSVTLPANLKTKGEQYLHDTQFEKMTLTVTAVDKHLLPGDFERIKVGDRIRCLSKPHGMDRFFPVTKRSIHLDAPEQDTITLGDTVSVSYTERANKDNDAIYQQIDHIPSQSATLKLAQDNATALLTAATTGHVVTRANEILIMDTDDTKTAQHVWRWDINGFGYSSNGINGPYETAITMDGHILGKFIYALSIYGNQITAGVIKSVDGNVAFDLDGNQLLIYDKSTKQKRLMVDGNGLTTLNEQGQIEMCVWNRAIDFFEDAPNAHLGWFGWAGSKEIDSIWEGWGFNADHCAKASICYDTDSAADWTSLVEFKRDGMHLCTPLLTDGYNVMLNRAETARLYADEAGSANIMASQNFGVGIGNKWIADFRREKITFGGTVSSNGGDFHGAVNMHCNTLDMAGNYGALINGYTNGILRLAGGSYVALVAGGGDIAYFDSSGLNMYGHSIVGQSDRRLKKNIKHPEVDPLEVIKQVEFVQYDWRKDDCHVGVGVIAQQLEQVAPELVETDKDGYKCINQTRLLHYALMAIQQLADKINENEQN